MTLTFHGNLINLQHLAIDLLRSKLILRLIINSVDLFMLFTFRFFLLVGFTICISACQDNKAISQSQKPVQHRKLPDIVTQSEAWDVLQTTSQRLRNQKQLNASELNEIHIITYSLEKAISYFATQSDSRIAQRAQAMATVVEDLHLNSENNRKEASQAASKNYFQLYEDFLIEAKPK